MTQSDSPLELLKEILENLRSPDLLDVHPWAASLTVQAAAAQDPALASKSPGARLILVVAELFRQMQPATPPQHNGKRLDTRWGRFGILASNYFAPLLYGRLYPHSMREAWRRIDQAIYLFACGLPEEKLNAEQLKTYRFVGDELDLAANSTISDWHREGMQELAQSFVDRERGLSLSMPGTPGPLKGDGGGEQPLASDGDDPRTLRGMSTRRLWAYGALAVLFVVAAWAGILAYRLDQRLQAVKQDLTALSALDLASLQPEALKHAGPLLLQTHAHVIVLQTEIAPYFWLTRRLGWLPVYGGDLKYADELLAMAAGATDAASGTYQAVTPIWDALQQQQDLGAPQLTQMLISTRPALLRAQSTLHEAIASRQRISDAELSTQVRGMLTRADPYLKTLDSTLSLALSVPGLLGATDTGPKTYLILVQNEDELRPTGGLISAVGKVVVRDGAIMDLTLEDSYAVDDINKPYPAAPWQLQSFMNIPIMLFRDTSWFTDYPTAVRWAEFLYTYKYSYSADGVITVDQHVLQKILSVTGPVYVSGIDTTVSSENVSGVMRAQKIPPPAEQDDPDWQRKHFINPISAAILERLITGHGVSWEQLLKALVDELDQRHILVQLDDPSLTAFLAERGWDGAVRPHAGDFLMVVDTNVGYNKTNAVVTSRLVVDVDLTDTAAPRSNLEVFQQNGAKGPAGPCDELPSDVDSPTFEAWYKIDRCYYNYLRVYVLAGTQLLAATPHAVTQADMVMLDADVPARVDLLDESIDHVQGFGTLLVVPMQGSLETSFQFGLPAGILHPGAQAGQWTYDLRIQKQPGTVAVPVTLRVHLPYGAAVESASPGSVQQGDDLLWELDLRTDIHVHVAFRR